MVYYATYREKGELRREGIGRRLGPPPGCVGLEVGADLLEDVIHGVAEFFVEHLEGS